MRTQVLIIGGGITGTGLARDLALRGVESLVIERADINAGASGRNHGLLHSGGRYVATDPAAASECRLENDILKQVAPHCIEDTGGLFVAVEGDEEAYIADFPHHCRKCGIPCQALDPKEARHLEPALSQKTIAAFRVNDAAVDPFRMSLENIAHAQELGAKLLCHTQVTGFETSRRNIRTAHLTNVNTGEKTHIEADQVINAAGAWSGQVASLAGISLSLLYSKGTLLVTDHRLSRHVVNRLRPPDDGDILVPGGTVSILGTTSVRIPSLERIAPTIQEVDQVVEEGAAMIPVLGQARYIRAYAGVRPLMQEADAGNDRTVSRGFSLLDHTADGIENLVSLPAGKLTTFRLMAEKTADLICHRLGNTHPCKTKTAPLPSTDAGQWTEPGLGPKLWVQEKGAGGQPLCECEIVPKRLVDHVIDSIMDQGLGPDLLGISLRSRVGKGGCQGTFCGGRVTGHLYERGLVTGNEGLASLKAFLKERWKGERPVLWDAQLIQAELKEALYCGLSGLEQ